MADTPHSPPGLPVVGNAPRFGDDPLRFLEGVQAAYGGRYPFVEVSAPGDETLTVVTDARAVEEILADHDRFGKPDFQPRRREMLAGRGLLTSEGDTWADQRDVLDPLFVGPVLAEYAGVAGDAVAALTAGWTDGDRIDLLEEMTVLTTQVVSRSLFSRDVTRSQGEQMYEAMNAVGRELTLSAIGAVRPEWMPANPSRAYREATDFIERFAADIIEAHRRPDPPEDMITALMAAREDPEVELADNELRDEVMTFTVAGHETTALTLAYALYWLSKHPEKRRRVREEAESVLDGAPEWADLSELRYTERVVRETTRLTPAVWTMFREADRPTEIAGCQIEAGEPLVLSQWAHHRDPAAFEDPGEFRPERWSQSASRATASYFPFGGGGRVCIGRNLALTETQFALAGILQEYDLEVAADDLDFRPTLTLQPTTPMEATIHARG